MARKLVIEILGDTAQLERSFKRARRETDRFGRQMSQTSRGAIAGSLAFKGLGRSVAFASLPFLGGAGLVAGLKGASAAASSVAEQISKSNVVFGDAAKVVQNFADNALGLANQEALRITGTFGGLLRPMGFLEEAAADTSIQLTKLGVDLASFHDLPIEQALDALRSGLVGETEPLRVFSIRLSEARVQQEALRQTGKKSVKQLTDQEKTLARLAIIMRDSSQAQGDFARTSGGLANQQRILAANLRDLSAEIGQVLNPVVLDMTKKLNKFLADPKNKKKVIEDFTTAIEGLAAAAEFTADAFGLLKSAWDALPDFGKDKGLVGHIKMGSGLEEELQAKLLEMGGGGGKAWGVGIVKQFNKEWKAVVKNARKTIEGNPLIGDGTAADPMSKRPGISQAQRNTWFDTLIGRALDRVQDVKTLQGQVAALGQIAGLVRERLAHTKDITRTQKLEDDLLDIGRQQASLNEQIALNKLDAKRLGLEKERERLSRERERIAQRIAANKSAQFRALGLTGGGDEIVAGTRLLKKQLGRVSDVVAGTFLDTDKTQSILAKVRRVLKGGIGAVGRDVRQAIKGILDDFDRQIKDRGGQETTFRHVATQNLFKGLGLTPEQLRAARTQVATVGMNGMGASRTGQFAAQSGRSIGGVTITGTVNVHGVQDMRAFENEIERRARSRANVRRGAR